MGPSLDGTDKWQCWEVTDRIMYYVRLEEMSSPRTTNSTKKVMIRAIQRQQYGY